MAISFDRITTKVLAGCLAVATMTFSSVQAYGEKEKIRTTTLELPPFMDKSNTLVLNQIILEAMKAVDVDFEFKYVPWARVPQEFATEGMDASIGSSKKRFSDLSVSILGLRIILFYKKKAGYKPHFDKLEEMAGKAVAVNVGAAWIPTMKEAGMNVQESPNPTIFPKLIAGRVDFTSAVDLAGYALIKETIPESADQVDWINSTVYNHNWEIYFKSTPRGKKLHKLFVDGMTAVKKSGVYEKLVAEQYGGVDKIPENVLIP